MQTTVFIFIALITFSFGVPQNQKSVVVQRQHSPNTTPVNSIKNNPDQLSGNRNTGPITDPRLRQFGYNPAQTMNVPMPNGPMPNPNMFGMNPMGPTGMPTPNQPMNLQSLMNAAQQLFGGVPPMGQPQFGAQQPMGFQQPPPQMFNNPQPANPNFMNPTGYGAGMNPMGASAAYNPLLAGLNALMGRSPFMGPPCPPYGAPYYNQQTYHPLYGYSQPNNQPTADLMGKNEKTRENSKEAGEGSYGPEKIRCICEPQ